MRKREFFVYDLSFFYWGGEKKILIFFFLSYVYEASYIDKVYHKPHIDVKPEEKEEKKLSVC